MQKKTVVLLSGGPDSTTLLFDLLDQGFEVKALTFNFGEQEGLEEQEAAGAVARAAGVSWHHVDFSQPVRRLYQLPFPQYMRGPNQHMQAGSIAESETLQPFGSAISLMLAGSWAIKNGINDVHYGVHEGDALCLDNNPGYFKALGDVTAACEGEEHRVTFHTPYLSIPKHAVIGRGLELSVPYELTWSCTHGGEMHCGACEPCINRRYAFELNGVTDPAKYSINPLTAGAHTLA